MPDPRLGRIFREDPRDAGYLMARELPDEAVHPTGAKLWRTPAGILYDQGQTPRCVGYGNSGNYSTMKAAELNGATVVFDADKLYAWANAHDGDPTPHDGSTVRAGLEGLVKVGDTVLKSTDTADDPLKTSQKIASYLWADMRATDADIDRIITWVLTKSPVVIGVPWLNAMFDPDPKTGYIHATGPVEGGHCLFIRGVNANDPANTYFVLRNSWGAWGVHVQDDWSVDLKTAAGDALITKADLVKLLKNQGEAGALVDTVVPAPPAPQPAPAPTPPPAPAPTPAPPTPTPPAPTPTPEDKGLLTEIADVLEALVQKIRNAIGSW